MLDYKPEGQGLAAASLTSAELIAAQQSGQIIEATALAFDHLQRLKFNILGKTAYMPYEECADGLDTGLVRDIAILTRVGRSTCFAVTHWPSNDDEALLSRRQAQTECKQNYLDGLVPGDVIPCTVTHIETFGAFCDVGCGISALLPIDCLSVSRIQSPADRVSTGDSLLCAVKSRDAKGRLVLTLRELLGTWQQNAERFEVGETVVGIVRSIENYGVFIEIAPNLAGLAEYCDGLATGQPVSVYIKNILPDKMKIKLSIVNSALATSLHFGPQYFITEGHIGHWVYSTENSKKIVETNFDATPDVRLSNMLDSMKESE